MASSAKVNYVRGIVICHGKSEVNMVRYITTNLHLNIKQFSKDNGRHSIQITSLMSTLKAKPFNKMSSITVEYPIEVQGKGSHKHLNGFKLFIIMDTDDCTSQEKAAFKNKEMFREHWLYDYIVPIYNEESLEDVLLDAGIMVQRIGDKEKGTYYDKIFPINSKPFSEDTVCEVETFKSKIRQSRKTNLLELIDYCLNLLQK